ncbi:MAG: 16S rRNA (cytosine(1402)-N(4))-methyltransferase RsmH [Candidatus Omnitrophica bacterium]|nr:16S rRNA (cytosine(1402)-N(4))-methyltransferase RsmH [Candidatus Omnitrophota bacterium]
MEPPISAFRSNDDAPRHHPVLREAVVELLAPQPGQVIVDCTLGLGGHALALLPRLMEAGRLIGLDADPQALDLARTRLAEFAPHVEFVHANFRDLPHTLSSLGLARVHGVLADLGMSSFQVDTPERGFSFLREGPLDMRMDPAQPLTAQEIVSRWPERDLAELLFSQGEERWARRIARRIVESRRREPIRTTAQLAQLVAEAVPGGRGHGQRIHPATRTFQALRIAVNDELSSLEALLRALPDVLAPGGRAAIIAFHSLEDRAVKQAFQRGGREGVYRVLTRKPQRASEQEIAEHPRSRSARLRAVERLA